MTMVTPNVHESLNFTAGTRNVATWCEALQHAGDVALREGRIVSIWAARSRTLLATVGPSGRCVSHR